MALTHLFFDVHDVLIDNALNIPCYATGIGRVLVERYGGSEDAWAAANRKVIADWDSYYTDLNLSGDEGMHDYFEGMFRTTRALFRLTGTPEPPFEELWALTLELPGLATKGCDALYPDARDALSRLRDLGLTLGVVSGAPENQIRTSLEPVIDLFTGLISGSDTADRFDKDEERYLAVALRSGVPRDSCLIVDDKADPTAAARRAGLLSAQCDRARRVQRSPAHYLIRNLVELMPICEALI
ncbi:MAG: HAD hydrolase-like protein [Chloroflexi bacterium]|nr:HAD hydrolase-like protein [Chloroflexota bacterium]